MRIFINYKTTDAPWGGGNSFIRAFTRYCINNGVELAKSINDKYDVLLASAAHSAPGKHIDLNEILARV